MNSKRSGIPDMTPQKPPMNVLENHMYKFGGLGALISHPASSYST